MSEIIYYRLRWKVEGADYLNGHTTYSNYKDAANAVRVLQEESDRLGHTLKYTFQKITTEVIEEGGMRSESALIKEAYDALTRGLTIESYQAIEELQEYNLETVRQTLLDLVDMISEVQRDLDSEDN